MSSGSGSSSGLGPGPGATASLAIDKDKFPSLPTQKALLMIDFQNDFVSKDSALPVAVADDALVERAARFASGFRDVGLIIWVQSQFEKPRRFIEGQQIITESKSADAPSARDPKAPPCPEAFLSSKNPACVVRGTPGWQLAAPLKRIVDLKRDILLMKTDYSAFRGTRLIQTLRSRLVTTLYMCGSLVNVGVHATAVDAAAHGYSITLVRDCCGWSDKARADLAIANLADESGCLVTKARNVVPSIGAEDDATEREKKMADKIKGKVQTLEADDAVETAGKDEKRLGNKMGEKVQTIEADDAIGPASEEDSTIGRGKRMVDKIQEKAQALGLDDTIEASSEGDEMASEDEMDTGDASGALLEFRKKYPGSKIALSRSRGAWAQRRDDLKSSDETLQKAATSSSRRRLGKHTSESKDERPAEEIQKGIADLSLSSAPKRRPPVPSAVPSDPDEKAKSGRAGASAGSTTSSSKTTTPQQGPRCDDEKEGAGNDSEPHGITAAPEHSSPPSPGSKGSNATEPRDIAPGPASDPTLQTTEAQTTESPRPAPTPASGAPVAPPLSQDPPPDDSRAGADVPPPRVNESEPICEGDTKVIYDVLPPDLEAGIFERLREEVDWQHMSHLGGSVPRLVAVQGAVGADGSHPVYRHPADESPALRPFSPAVEELRAVVEAHLGHGVNHVLLQLYRGGRDYISEHSDKTLDIVRGSYIANLSLGAERTMIFRRKREQGGVGQGSSSTPPAPSPDPSTTSTSATTTTTTTASPSGRDGKGSKVGGGSASTRESHRARLPHNSLVRMGLSTNASWLHSIRQDKRADRDRSAAELAFEGARISLTFRQIGTFLDAGEGLIWGQGARGKDREGAGRVVNGDEGEGRRLVTAFGVENRTGAEFEWARWYGEGFDVLHMTGK